MTGDYDKLLAPEEAAKPAKPKQQRTRLPLVERTWLSPRDVGDLAGGLSPQYVRAFIKDGRLPAMTLPSRGKEKLLPRYRIHRDAARKFIAEMCPADVPRGK